jgi:hypothetical protein
LGVGGIGAQPTVAKVVLRPGAALICINARSASLERQSDAKPAPAPIEIDQCRTASQI